MIDGLHSVSTEAKRQVAVIGAGRMGSALARCLKNSGFGVGIWARTRQTRERLSDIAAPVDTLGEAIGDAPLILICLPDYAASRECLDEISGLLNDRTVVQLSSGGPADAVGLADWTKAAGALYLDGAIATFPRRIGDASTTLFLSGSHDAWLRHGGTLRFLGGRATYLGTNVSAAAAADLAWLSIYYGIAFGFLQGAAFFEAGGLDPASLFESTPSFLVEMGDAASEYWDMIRSNVYKGDQATIDVHRAAIEHLSSSARSTGVDSRFVDVGAELLDEAISAGSGGSEIAAVFNILRGGRRNRGRFPCGGSFLCGADMIHPIDDSDWIRT